MNANGTCPVINGRATDEQLYITQQCVPVADPEEGVIGSHIVPLLGPNKTTRVVIRGPPTSGFSTFWYEIGPTLHGTLKSKTPGPSLSPIPSWSLLLEKRFGRSQMCWAIGDTSSTVHCPVDTRAAASGQPAVYGASPAGAAAAAAVSDLWRAAVTGAAGGALLTAHCSPMPTPSARCTSPNAQCPPSARWLREPPRELLTGAAPEATDGSRPGGHGRC